MAATTGASDDTRALAITPRQRAALWRYLRLLGADASDADDLAQEACVIALRRADFDGSSPAGVFAFLRTTARHLFLRHVRARRHRIGERELAEADAIWDARCADGTGDDYLAALHDCVAALPTRSRALLDATYGAGLGRAAAGAGLGLGADGVKSALRRLRAALHDCIRRRLEEER